MVCGARAAHAGRRYIFLQRLEHTSAFPTDILLSRTWTKVHRRFHVCSTIPAAFHTAGNFCARLTSASAVETDNSRRAARAATRDCPHSVLQRKKPSCSLRANNVAIIKRWNVPKLAADVKDGSGQSHDYGGGFFTFVVLYYVHRQLRFAASITA